MEAVTSGNETATSGNGVPVKIIMGARDVAGMTSGCCTWTAPARLATESARAPDPVAALHDALTNDTTVLMSTVADVTANPAPATVAPPVAGAVDADVNVGSRTSVSSTSRTISSEMGGVAERERCRRPPARMRGLVFFLTQ